MIDRHFWSRFAVAAPSACAHPMRREAIGIDVSYDAVRLIQRRMTVNFGEKADLTIAGIPADIARIAGRARCRDYAFQSRDRLLRWGAFRAKPTLPAPRSVGNSSYWTYRSDSRQWVTVPGCSISDAFSSISTDRRSSSATTSRFASAAAMLRSDAATHRIVMAV